MKTNILSFLLISFFAVTFPSCEGPMGPMGPAGPEGVGSWDVFEMTVRSGDWFWDMDRKVYYYDFEEPAISRFIAEDGLVQVSMRFGDVYYPLPDVRNFYDDGYITETVSYEYAARWIRFNVSANDLFNNLPLNYQPETFTFKVTLLW